MTAPVESEAALLPTPGSVPGPAPGPVAAGAATPPTSRSPWRHRRTRTLLRNWPAMLGAAVLFVLVLSAVLAPLIAPYDPNSTSLLTRFQSPSLDHLLGTDQLGRDVLSRLIYAGRVSLLAGIGSVGVALLLAIPVGLIAGLVGGKLESAIMGFVDMVLSIPPLILVFAVAGVLGPGLTNTVIALAVYFFPLFVKLIRGETRLIVRSQLVEAERAVGISNTRLMWRHLLPILAPPVIVQASLAVGTGIIAEASLSFLGLGVQPPTATWGVMLQDGYSVMTSHPWMVVIPALTVALTVLALNQLGDGLRDALARLEAHQ